jgi:hypothetical protein
MGSGRTEPRPPGRPLAQGLSPIATIELPVTTIQLTPERRDQLKRLRVAGLSYDDVIGHLLANVDEEKFRASILKWEADAARAIRGNPKNRRIA